MADEFAVLILCAEPVKVLIIRLSAIEITDTMTKSVVPVAFVRDRAVAGRARRAAAEETTRR